MEEALIHYGIIGMKWGIRRTPEELGHRKAEQAKGKLQRYKQKKLDKVDKMYARSIRKIQEGLEYDPGNKELTNQLKELESLRKADRDKIDKMSYTDVVREQKETRDRRIQTAGKVVKGTAATVGSVSLWALKMGLVGVRIYGTFKAAEIVGALAKEGYDWLQGPEGQELIAKGYNAINTFMRVGDTAAKIANPELGKYVDSEKLAKMAVETGTQYAKNEIQRLRGG